MRTCLCVMTLLLALSAGADSKAVWHQFHGPERRNISPDTGLLKEWPIDGPKMIWQYSECGTGFGGIAIAENRIFSSGDFGQDEMLFALSLDGKLIWKTRNGESWRGPSPGSRTTPTYVEGVLYHMNPTGTLGAFRADSGEPVWSVDLKAKFGIRHGTWALAENVLVDGDKVLCLPGGQEGSAAALDRTSGKTIWVNAEMDRRAAYCSPIIVTHKGVRQMITVSQRSAIGIDVRTGELLWSHSHGRFGQNTTPPVYKDGYVFITCGHSAGGTLLKISDDSRSVQQVWHLEEFDNCHGGIILQAGNMYGCGCRLGGKGFFCVDFMTGRMKQTDRTLGKVSLTYADGMIYSLNDNRQMALLSVIPDGFNVVSRFEMPDLGKGPSLSHPVVCGGRLYVRHDQYLFVYDVSADGKR